MSTPRTYADACGAAHGLDLVGERWALLVVRELLLGGKRFSDLKADLPGISTNVLTARLAELERYGVVAKRRLPPPAASTVYELTEWGHGLEPVVCALGRWAARSPLHDPGLPLSTASFVLSMRTNADPERLAGQDLDVALVLGDHVFRATVEDGAFSVVRGDVAGAQAVLRSDGRSLAGVVYGGWPLAEAVAAGAVEVEGDLDRAARLLGVFTLPEPAPLPA